MKQHGIPVGLDEFGLADNELVSDRLAAVSAEEHAAHQVRHSAPLPGCLDFKGVRHPRREKHGYFHLVRHGLSACDTTVNSVTNVSHWQTAPATELLEIPNFGTNGGRRALCRVRTHLSALAITSWVLSIPR